jgi:hypothetical protein
MTMNRTWPGSPETVPVLWGFKGTVPVSSKIPFGELNVAGFPKS